MRDHRNLRAFQLADELALLVYQDTKHFPKEEMFGLTSQIRRSAVSVPSNIVEGCGRQSEADLVRFLDIANGSLRELQYQLSLASRLGYLPQNSPLQGDQSIVLETGRVLYGLLRSFRPDTLREANCEYEASHWNWETEDQKTLSG